MFRRPILSTLVFISFTGSVAGYGEKVDSLPLWQERAVLVLTNACRMAPIAFRDRYIVNSTILLPTNYPAVPPLYWNRELNAASRFHCVEMGLGCGMQHECNGVSFADRLKSFYTKSSTIGENIAMGYQAPQLVVTGWLIDGQSASTAAPDGNGDGHRANIMSPRYREIGCGYFLAGSGKSAKDYWCQDFGGGKSTFAYHPVCAASHLFFTKGQITFWANLYDTAKTVAGLSLILDGTKTPMKLDIGTASAGTYALTVPAVTTCRNYVVEITYTDGRTLRYPETGTLPTVGEGTCSESGAGTRFADSRITRRSIARDAEVCVKRRDGIIELAVVPAAKACPSTTTTIDCKGTFREQARWSGGVARLSSAGLQHGLLLFIHTYPDGSSIVRKCVLPQ